MVIHKSDESWNEEQKKQRDYSNIVESSNKTLALEYIFRKETPLLPFVYKDIIHFWLLRRLSGMSRGSSHSYKWLRASILLACMPDKLLRRHVWAMASTYDFDLVCIVPVRNTRDCSTVGTWTCGWHPRQVRTCTRSSKLHICCHSRFYGGEVKRESITNVVVVCC